MGETMAVMSGTGVGPLRHESTLRLGVAGAEATVAIGLRRLGVPAAYLGRVGDDELGRAVLMRLRGEGVDVEFVRVDPEAATGLMVKERRTTKVSRVRYYRTGSAGSRLAPADVPESLVVGARVLHVTGITAALSDSCREAVRLGMDLAKAHGVLVSLDYNYRAALWPPEEAREVLRDLTSYADVVFAGDDEARMVADLGLAATPEETLHAFASLGAGQVVVKLGAQGALGLADGTVSRVPAIPIEVLDPVGAGDAFAAGYLAALLRGESFEQRLRWGSRLGAFAVASSGDWEGLPLLDELGLLDRADGDVLR